MIKTTLRCPRCQQDYLVRAIIKPLDFHIVICPECEAFWAKHTPIKKSTFFNYCSFTSDKGLPCVWDILEVVEKWPEQKVEPNEWLE